MKRSAMTGTAGKSRQRQINKLIMLFALMFFPLALTAQSSKRAHFDPALYVTPLEKYSEIGRGLGARYKSQLNSMAGLIIAQMKSDRFELFDSKASLMGGVGFFGNVSHPESPVRFLGVAARVKINLTYFPDTDAGRFSDAMDAFGKDLLKIQWDNINRGPGEEVEGALLVMVYSRRGLDDPEYYADAQAVALFAPGETLREFFHYRIRMDQFMQASRVYAFSGDEQIKMLLTEFMRG